MKTEELMRREAEYRVVREALGTYHLDVAAARLGPARPGASRGLGGAADTIRQCVPSDECCPRLDAAVRSGPQDSSEAEPPAATQSP
jgi:hypothetical protein